MGKNLFAICFYLLFLPLLFAKPEAKITVHVVSDQGQPLMNIPISLSTFNHFQPGEGFGRDIYSNLTGKTDIKGFVSFSIESVRGDMGIGTDYPLVGVYQGNIGYQFININSGKWQPWNPTVEFVVKPILNPIPMYAQNINLDIPLTNTPVGFDLEAGDWVAPYGKGTVSDFIFTMAEKIPFTKYNQPYDLTWTLSFLNKGDGIQSVLVPQNAGSALRLPRYAPETGYLPTLVQELSLNGNKRINGADGEDQNYFYRVRTVLDENGNVKSAVYGKIAGPIQYWGNKDVHMIYYLNPTPNDRNMEFNPKKNLFQNLPTLQQVNAP